MFYSSSCLSYPPPVFSFSSVSFCGSPLSCFYVFLVLCFLFVSHLNVFALCFSSFFLLFLIFCVFFSPGPRVRLKRTTMERTTISLCLPFGDLCENVLCAKLLFFFVDSFCSQNMFSLDILGICFEGVRDSLLLLICCYIVVLVFGEEPSFCPICLLCQHFGDSFCVCSCFLYFGCFCFFRVLLRSIFCFAYLPHLGLLFLGCCVVVLVFKLHVLAGCLCVSVSVLSFCGEPCGGGGLWVGPTGRGQNIFWRFS